MKAVKMVVFLAGFSLLYLIPSLAIASEETDTLTLSARLIEIPGKFAPNDLYNYVYIMKYRVLKIEKGTYSEKEILVGHYNPLIARTKIKDKMAVSVKGNLEKFTIGATHRLTLIKPVSAVWDGAVEDEYFDSELEKYFALTANDATSQKR